ncbi:MAG: hypothetical protein ACR2G7_03185 [Acidimicrobiales bacterium]
MTEQELPDEQLSPDQMRQGAKVSRQSLEPNEMTTWDGEGDPVKGVFTDNEAGVLAEGTGSSTEDALKDAEEGDEILGDDAGPKGH